MTGKTARMKLVLVNEARVVTGALESIARAATPHGYDVEICIGSGRYRPVAEAGCASEGEQVYLSRPLRTVGSRRNGLTRLALMVSFVMSLLWYLARAPSPNTIILFSQPPFLHMIIPMLKKFVSSKIVSVQMDRYPDILFAYGVIAKRGVFGRLLKSCDRWGLEAADRVVCIGRDMQQQLAADGVPSRRLALVPNWSKDLQNDWTEPACASDQAYQDDPETFSVLYSGNMGVAHTFSELLDAVEQMRCDDRIEVCLRGAGRRWEEVSDEITRRRLERVHLKGLLPFDQYAQAITAAGAILITLREGFEGVLVPSKYYAALSAGRPVVFVGPEDSEIARSVIEENCGTVVPNGEPARLLHALRRYASDADLRQLHGGNARAAFERNYTEFVGAERYVALVQDLDRSVTSGGG